MTKTGTHPFEGGQSGVALSPASGTLLACATVSLIFKGLEPTKTSLRHQKINPTGLESGKDLLRATQLPRDRAGKRPWASSLLWAMNSKVRTHPQDELFWGDLQGSCPAAESCIDRQRLPFLLVCSRSRRKTQTDVG